MKGFEPALDDKYVKIVNTPGQGRPQVGEILLPSVHSLRGLVPGLAVAQSCWRGLLLSV